jgi:hypothetical protein
MIGSTWWDPSIQADAHFLQLAPFLNQLSLQQYNILPKELVRQTHEAVDAGNVPAAIGALRLWQARRRGSEVTGEFELVHLAYLDRLFYLSSLDRMGSGMEVWLNWYARLIFGSWCRTQSTAGLLRLQESLRSAINLMEVAFNEPARESIQEQHIALAIMELLQDAMIDPRTEGDRKYFQQKFKEH